MARPNPVSEAIPLGAGWWRTGHRLGAEHGFLDPGLLPDGNWAARPTVAFLEAALADDEAPIGSLLAAADPSPASGHASSPEAAAQARVAAGLRALARPPARPVEWMAVLNLTPDSFSDGGRLDPNGALQARAEAAQAQGASWLDLGAESTRPGAQDIPADAQLARLLPAIEQLRPLGVPLSIDTRSAAVAEACLAAGARMINDVSGGADPEMASTCARHDADLVLMHMRGTPADMQQHVGYRHLLGEVADELGAAARRALAAGVRAERLMLDPGIGFAKTPAQSRQMLARLGALRALGFDLLVGPSRKSFQAELIPERSAAERDCGTAGAASLCIQQGATTLRLHSGDYWDAARVAAGLAATSPSHPALPDGLRFDPAE